MQDFDAEDNSKLDMQVHLGPVERTVGLLDVSMGLDQFIRRGKPCCEFLTVLLRVDLSESDSLPDSGWTGSVLTGSNTVIG